MYTEKDREDYVQWAKDTGRTKEGLTDVYVNDNGEMKIEKRMAWTIQCSPDDWKEFCKATGREYIRTELVVLT